MRKIALVARREYMENVRTKGFWIGVLAFPLILALSVVVPILLIGTKQARTYAVIDHSGFVLKEVEKGILAEDLGIVLRAAAARYRDGGSAWERLPAAVRAAAKGYVSLAEGERPALVQDLAAGKGESAAGLVEWWQQVSAEELEALDLELSRSRYVRVDLPSGDDAPAALNRMVNDGALFAYFVIAPDPVANDEGCKYISLNLTDRDLRHWFADRVFQVVRARRIAQAGLDAETSHWLQTPVHFAERKVDKRGGEAEVSTGDKVQQWAVIPFVYLLWMAIFINAQMLMTNTVEEKSSRLIEVLLSALSPFELMAGKIAGTAAVGLTLVFTWVVCVVVGVVVAPAALGDDAASIVGIAGTPLYLWSFVFYFLAGFLLYACLLVGAGSLCNSLKDAQSLMLPLLHPADRAVAYDGTHHPRPQRHLGTGYVLHTAFYPFCHDEPGRWLTALVGVFGYHSAASLVYLLCGAWSGQGLPHRHFDDGQAAALGRGHALVDGQGRHQPSRARSELNQLSEIRRLARTRMLCSMVEVSGASPAQRRYALKASMAFR